MHLETIAIHAGRAPDPATGAIAQPIHLSTTFERAADGGYPLGYEYSRSDNPNRRALETAVAALEGGEAGAAFSSGSAAAMTVFQALRPGDHLLAPRDFYFGIRKMLQELFVPWGLAVTFVDIDDLDQVRAAVRPKTRLVLVETPSNPLLSVADLGALAEIAHETGAALLVDNTIATPILQRPFELGADLIMHATTKYLGGHSDVLSGLVLTRSENDLWARIRTVQGLAGAVPSPFECWLALRGLDTLAYRVAAQAAGALRLARFLAEHPAVEQVLYPGLEGHPSHAVARRQMRGYGGLLSVLVRGGAEAAMAAAARAKLFTRATSFGGTHSLIEHRASMEGPDSKTPPNLLRLSVGLENPEDLVADLDQALGRE